ncbi:unnamed protein product [Durusdinium trenchii]|uniref:Uncharacterized protein n=2 Tax=Durusdinium trenchii TaxID=1381693 RepID=A0ABP0HT00_9DINO
MPFAKKDLPKLVGDETQHHSRKVARDAATKHGGLVTPNERAQFGGKENKKKDKYGAGRSLRHDGDGGTRSVKRPAWLEGDVAVKELDLHRFDSASDAFKEIGSRINKLGEETALEIVCGAGTHTEVNKHGRNVKETGDWKNKAQPLFFQVKEMVKKSSALKCWIPAEHKQSSIYVRLASASAADLLKEELAKLTLQEEKRERQIPFESEEETGDEDEVQYDSFGNTISP